MDKKKGARRRSASGLERVLRRLNDDEVAEMGRVWPLPAHEGQDGPRRSELIRLLMAGRGFGKTRAGAEWVSQIARDNPKARIALVGASLGDVAEVMVRGSSGLMAAARSDEDVIFVPSSGIVTFASGAQAFAYSGHQPDGLRGPEHHAAWCDEIAKWRHPEATWDNLMLGLRLGERPQAMVTTTPRPMTLLKRIKADPECGTRQGRTADNAHLPAAFVRAVTERYGGTRLGRQELDGELIEEVEGALWTRDGIEKARLLLSSGEMVRVVIGVDPPASAEGDACGIVACGLGADGVGYVLGDHSVGGVSPEGWAAAVASAAALHGADRVVAEANNGGAMVRSVLQAADCNLPVALVHASRGKSARAEPVALLFENGRAKFAGRFAELEDELRGLALGGAYAGPGRSPDRADAMVWALSELMLGKRRGPPAVRGL